MEALLMFILPLLVYISFKVAIWRDIDAVERERKAFRYGIYLYESQQYDKALAYFNEKIYNNRKCATAHYYRACVHFKLENYHSCLYDCDQAIKFTNDYLDLYLLKSRCFLKLKELDQALRYIDIYLSHHTGISLSAGHRWKGIILYQMRQYEAANQEFSKAVAYASSTKRKKPTATSLKWTV